MYVLIQKHLSTPRFAKGAIGFGWYRDILHTYVAYRYQMRLGHTPAVHRTPGKCTRTRNVLNLVEKQHEKNKYRDFAWFTSSPKWIDLGVPVYLIFVIRCAIVNYFCSKLVTILFTICRNWFIIGIIAIMKAVYLLLVREMNIHAPSLFSYERTNPRPRELANDWTLTNHFVTSNRNWEIFWNFNGPHCFFCILKAGIIWRLKGAEYFRCSVAVEYQ